MRAFVIGTGRCGTVTFSKACRHISNFSSSHESKSGQSTSARFEYPDQHIEVDPHLAWTLGPIIKQYPDAIYVHLQRKREEVVRSWFRRGIIPHRGAAPLINVICQTNVSQLSVTDYQNSLGLLYDVVNENIEVALQQVPSIHIWLHDPLEDFSHFWELIEAKGNFAAASVEFQRRYNAGAV